MNEIDASKMKYVNWCGNMQEEQALQGRFREEILRQMKQQSWLCDSEYKQGMYDALNDILDQIRQYKDASAQQHS